MEEGVDWEEPRPRGLSIPQSPAQSLDSQVC